MLSFSKSNKGKASSRKAEQRRSAEADGKPTQTSAKPRREPVAGNVPDLKTLKTPSERRRAIEDYKQSLRPGRSLRYGADGKVER